MRHGTANSEQETGQGHWRFRTEVRTVQGCGAVPLLHARFCGRCKCVGEETALNRCPRCGTKDGMVPLLQVSTLEHLLGMLAVGDVPKEMTLLELAEAVKVEAIQKALLESQGNCSEAAMALGIHRNTVTRIMARKQAA